MSRPLRTLVLGVVDVCVAGFIALVFWMNAGVAGQSDTNPPTCATSSGRTVDCSLESPLDLAAAAIFIAALAALVGTQAVRARRRRARLRVD